jgi:transcriptional regulator with XRE-family HTH domain
MDKPAKKNDNPAKKVGRPVKKINISRDGAGYTVFFERYMEACHKRAVSPTAVAVAIGENNNAASRWKSGVVPNGTVLLKLSEYLAVSVDYLLGNNSYDYSIQGKELIEIFMGLPESQKYALLSVAHKLKEQDTCLNVSLGKKQAANTEINHNYV